MCSTLNLPIVTLNKARECTALLRLADKYIALSEGVILESFLFPLCNKTFCRSLGDNKDLGLQVKSCGRFHHNKKI